MLKSLPSEPPLVGIRTVWIVIEALWVILPAYLPNSIAVVVGGGRPIDGGRTWRDRRLLGDGKTWRGFIGGTVGGIALAFGLNAIQAGLSLPLPRFPARVAVSFPFGAMLGDAGGSFLKRRTGRERGAPFPIVDQLGFVVGALGLSVLVAPEWTTTTVTPPVLVVVLVATPLLHLGTNGVAYVLGLKEEPW